MSTTEPAPAPDRDDRSSLSPTNVAAMLLAPLGVIVACLAIPSGVDELPTSATKMAKTLAIVEQHPFATRLGFLAFAVGMLLLIPAMAGVRQVSGRQVSCCARIAGRRPASTPPADIAPSQSSARYASPPCGAIRRQVSETVGSSTRWAMMAAGHDPPRQPRHGEVRRMAEEFEGRDLSGAVFWGVDLSGARFRDVNLTGVRISHAWVKDVEIDAHVDHVTINGVDVTDYVNERDPWYPLRAAVQASDPPSMRAAWATIDGAWTATIERARRLTDDQLHQSVGGEWSLVETLRHLVFAMDKWFTVPIAGGAFHPFGLPNTGSRDFGWPGLDPGAAPSLDEVLAVRADRSRRLREYLESLTDDELTRHVEVLENGDSPVNECIYTVFEEEFEHNRYATRDLAELE